MTSSMPGGSLVVSSGLVSDACRGPPSASCGEQPGIMGLRIAVIMRAKQHGLGLVCGPGLRRVLHRILRQCNPRRESGNVHGNVAIWL